MGKMVRTISEDGGIICCALDSTDMVYRAEQIHIRLQPLLLLLWAGL